MATDRQKQWAQAAAEDAERGNDVAAALFMLLAQPNERERADQPEPKAAS
jgi:hypothetical protein